MFVRLKCSFTTPKTKNGPFLQSNYISSQGSPFGALISSLTSFHVRNSLCPRANLFPSHLLNYLFLSLPLTTSKSLPHASLFVSVNRLWLSLSNKSLIYFCARMPQWWNHSSPTNVARVRIPYSASYVGWYCWFSTLHLEVFLRLFRIFTLKNQHLTWFALIVDLSLQYPQLVLQC